MAKILEEIPTAAVAAPVTREERGEADTASAGAVEDPTDAPAAAAGTNSEAEEEAAATPAPEEKESKNASA